MSSTCRRCENLRSARTDIGCLRYNHSVCREMRIGSNDSSKQGCAPVETATLPVGFRPAVAQLCATTTLFAALDVAGTAIETDGGAASVPGVVPRPRHGGERYTNRIRYPHRHQQRLQLQVQEVPVLRNAICARTSVMGKNQ